MLYDTSIPLPLAVWLLHDEYDYDKSEKHFSATQLLQPTRSLVLASRLPEPEEIDLHNLIAPKIGNAIHDSIEAAWNDVDARHKALKFLGYPEKMYKYLDVHIEERNYRSINDYLISGKFDLVINGNLFDFKSTSVWAWINGDKDDDYQKQGSIYKWLNPKLITSDTITICFIFTDWNKKDAAYQPLYPKTKIKQKEIPLLSMGQTETLIRRKLSEIEKNWLLEQDQMIKCTDTELWRSAPVYKYYASGDITKRATKTFNTAHEASCYKIQNKNKGTIMTVPGEPKRCKYCLAAPICQQRKEMTGED